MPPNSAHTLEVCAASATAVIASKGVADRIELCRGLAVGGVTPDIGLMECAAEVGIETHVLIRPKSGDFTLDQDELKVAVDSIRAVRQLGLQGVVIGAARDGALDRTALETMITAADGLSVTLHRVIDVVDDPFAALEIAKALGIERILSSGGAPCALGGIDRLNQLHAASEGQIEVMAGGGITHLSMPRIMAATEITSFHASCTQTQPLAPRYGQLGFGDVERSFDRDELYRLAAICRGGVSLGDIGS